MGKKSVKKYSLGMKQRLGIALALSELLRLDLYSLSSLRFVLVSLLKKGMCYKTLYILEEV